MAPNNGHSISFSKARVIQIERQNETLMKRINNSKSTIDVQPPKTLPWCSAKHSSAEINRRRRESKIDRENEVLRKKLEAIYQRKNR